MARGGKLEGDATGVGVSAEENPQRLLMCQTRRAGPSAAVDDDDDDDDDDDAVKERILNSPASGTDSHWCTPIGHALGSLTAESPFVPRIGRADETPLDEDAYGRLLAVVRLLMEHGASLDAAVAPRSRGRENLFMEYSALHLAAFKGRDSYARGADRAGTSRRGRVGWLTYLASLSLPVLSSCLSTATPEHNPSRK